MVIILFKQIFKTGQSLTLLDFTLLPVESKVKIGQLPGNTGDS